ncbi:MAG TPA: sugar phosphate nucleotidyltransferase [Acidimicrobiales bacterium]|nr:sugar phosphate nucleotidyltransferase [Acidimicrobiales bacterium]
METSDGRILVVVLAGGEGSRLGPLTERRAKPAVPVGGMFRLIDVALSNVANSGLTDVWVVEQYEPHDLNDHLANGRPWDLDRTRGGLRLLPPFQGRNDEGADDALASGNVDALVQQHRFIAELGPDVVITMSADHIYRLDLRAVLATHRAADARLTVVTTDPPADDDPRRFAWVAVGDGGRLTGFEYKPDRPRGDRVCTEVFAFDGADLVARLGSLAEAEGSAGDYGDALVPDMVADGLAVEHRMTGYWRDVGTIAAFHRAHMELTGDDPAIELDDPTWPFLTGSISSGPARVAASATVVRSLLSPGVRVEGVVEGSVLGRNVVVEGGATVYDSVVLDDAVVRAGARVRGAIVDVGAEVGEGSAGEADDSGVVVYTARRS